MSDIDYYCKRFNSLKERRLPFDNLWRDLANFVVPTRAYPFDTDQPSVANNETSKNRRYKTYDSTAEVALEIFASSLVGFLANPATNWFELTPTDERLLKVEGVAAWFDTATKRTLAAFSDTNAKFYTNLKMCATDIGVFGTVGMLIQPGKKSFLEFSSRNVKELYIAEDMSGNVDTVYRKLLMTARQVAEQFGVEKLSGPMRSRLKDKPDELVYIMHAIEPREGYDKSKKGNLNMPFKSVYIDEESKMILDEKGFEEMPIPVGRWEVFINDIYGTPPAARVLADIKMVNKMEQAHIVAVEKTLNPPLQMPDDGFLGNIDLSAGAINVYRSMTPGRLEPVQTIGNLPITLEMLASKRNLIREAFYIDQLQLMNSPQMTATEVMARTDEKLRLMSPMIGRIQSELLGPIIARSFNILLRLSEEREWDITAPFPQPPEILKQLDYEIRYVSPMERAQRASEANSIMAYINSIAPLSQIDPNILDNLNFDEVTRELHDIQSIPSSILKTKNEVNADRKARAAQQQAQQQMQMAAQVAEIASKAEAAEGI